MAGAKGGVLAHSQSSATVQRITINGREVGEIGQVAAIAGHFGIPVIMLSGDQAACDEFKQIQANAVTVAVKRMVGKASTLSLSHEEAKNQIATAAEQAVRHIAEYKPWKVPGPIEMVFEYSPQPPQQPNARASTGDTGCSNRT
jgi:D-amino peptidase